jgi:hypothetical protein
MADSIMPIFSAVYLCDEFVRDDASGKSHLVGLFDAFHPIEDQPPFILRKLCVFTQITDWQGAVEMRVDVARADTLDLAFTSPLLRFEVPSRNILVQVPIRFSNVSFDRHGDYLVELLCNGEFVQDRLLHVLGSDKG